jgi:curved DNA-binding protein CbpA
MNYYDTLEVIPHASYEIIRNAYRALAIKYHPDINRTNDKRNAEEKMKQVNLAYEILYNPIKRAEYDLYLKNNKSREQTNTNKDYDEQDKNKGKNHEEKAENYYKGNEKSDLFINLEVLVESVTIGASKTGNFRNKVKDIMNKSDYVIYSHFASVIRKNIYCLSAMAGSENEVKSLCKDFCKILTIVDSAKNDQILLKKVEACITLIFRNTLCPCTMSQQQPMMNQMGYKTTRDDGYEDEDDFRRHHKRGHR